MICCCALAGTEACKNCASKNSEMSIENNKILFEGEFDKEFVFTKEYLENNHLKLLEMIKEFAKNPIPFIKKTEGD